MTEGTLHVFSPTAVASTGGRGAGTEESPPPRLYNVIEVFQHINYVQNQNNFIKLVIMPYITELVSVSRNTLGNGNIN